MKYTDWPLVRLDSGNANSWGRMWVVGEILIIFDETILFSLLALMTKFQSDAFETDQEELCRMADVQPTPNTYNAIWKSIQRLAGTRIDLELFSGKGRKRKELKELTGSILSFADIDRENGSIRIVVNPYFLEMYADSFVTNIDLRFRSQSDIEITKLARAVNLETGLEMRRLKDKVRIGLKELQNRGYLKQYQITRDHRVIIEKAKDSAANYQSQILDPAKIPYYSD
jgi:predicted transcriptional regulator